MFEVFYTGVTQRLPGNEIDMKYIQKLLGHSRPKTTMIYTHVTETGIKKIKNPFDNL